MQGAKDSGIGCVGTKTSSTYSIPNDAILDGLPPTTLATIHGIMPPRPPLTVLKLSDHFGQ
jgi:hypothetical protein